MIVVVMGGTWASSSVARFLGFVILARCKVDSRYTSLVTDSVGMSWCDYTVLLSDLCN
jgi:hypothetical protein